MPQAICHLARGTKLEVSGHAATVERIGHNGVFVRLDDVQPPIVVEFNFAIVERAVFGN